MVRSVLRSMSRLSSPPRETAAASAHRAGVTPLRSLRRSGATTARCITPCAVSATTSTSLARSRPSCLSTTFAGRKVCDL